MSEQQRETPAPNAQQNGDSTAAAPAPASEPVIENNGNGDGAAIVDDLDHLGTEEVPVVRMRNAAPGADMNGQQASLNGHAAVQRGLEALAETEASQNTEGMLSIISLPSMTPSPQTPVPL